MAHTSLYRAYRPQSFADVVGQDQVVKPLIEQLKGKSVGHAYLFSGSRGLGKTSIARIFAKELGTTEKDLYEMDAASNNGVDDVRALADAVYTMPFESPYKVYILDEVHMFSKGAWNALLKTLEEPPAHAIFILATTELDKVPETVQSRCQVFSFKKPTREGLAAMVADVAKREGFSIEPSAADLIALLAEGSYRDALSVLQRVCAASPDKKIARTEAEAATGAPRHELVTGFVSALASGNGEAALIALQKVTAADADFSMYLTLVLEYVRAVLLVRHAPDLAKDIEKEWNADAFGEIKALASAKDSKLTHATLKALLDAASRMRFSPIPALALEVAVYELLGE